MMAYMFYFCGGFIVGSHHIYLESYTYAIVHQYTFGFAGLGMIVDFF